LHKRANRGSGGILLYIKKNLNESVKFLQNTNVDDRIWIKITSLEHGKCTDMPVYCCFCYIPPMDSAVMTHESAQWHIFENEMMNYSTEGGILLCGDLNARTGHAKDYIQDDSETPGTCAFVRYAVDTEISRMSRDVVVNSRGKNLLDLCVGARLRIVNGRHRGDKRGEYTCYTPRGCSVVDYLIVSSDLLPQICDFRVCSLETYSDHCPLQFEMQITHAKQLHDECTTPLYQLVQPLTWDDEICAKFRRELSESSTVDAVSELKHDIDKDTTTVAAERLAVLLRSIVAKCGGSRHKAPSKANRGKFPKHKWFDNSCKEQKRVVNDAWKRFLNQPTDYDAREEFYRQKKVYKKLIGVK